MKQNNNAFWPVVDAEETVAMRIGSVVVVRCPGEAVVSEAAVGVVGVSPTATSRGAPSGTCYKL